MAEAQYLMAECWSAIGGSDPSVRAIDGRRVYEPLPISKLEAQLQAEGWEVSARSTRRDDVCVVFTRRGPIRGAGGDDGSAEAEDEDEDDQSFYARRRRTLRSYDEELVQGFLPRARALIASPDPIDAFEAAVPEAWGRVQYGGMFNFFGALARLDDPRVTAFARDALGAVGRELAQALLESVPDARDAGYVESALRIYDALPAGGVIQGAGEAYLTLEVAAYTRGIDPASDPVRYAEGREKAVAHARWRRELRNGSTSEFTPLEAIAWNLSRDGHRLPAFAIALLPLIYPSATGEALPEHYFWTYYLSTAHDQDAAGFFFRELRAAQTQNFLRRLLEEAAFDGGFPPELDDLKYTPHAAKHFRALAGADADLAAQFPWMIRGS